MEKQLQVIKLDSHQKTNALYEKNISFIYLFFRFFYSEQKIHEILPDFAAKLKNAIYQSRFKKFEDLLCASVSYTQVVLDKNSKIQKSVISIEAPNESPFLTESSLRHLYQEDLSSIAILILKDFFHYNLQEVSSITSLSIGIITKRLQRIREKFLQNLESQSYPKSKKQEHVCLLVEEKIENLDLDSSKIKELITDCRKCEHHFELRKQSVKTLEHFQKNAVPNYAQSFPIQVFLNRQGNKLKFNLSASPWYFKLVFEGLLATTIVLGIVLSMPRIRSLYEFWLERRFDFYSAVEMAGGYFSSESLNTDQRSEPVILPQQTKDESTEDTESSPLLKSETEFIGKGSEIASSDKIYRILIKTDSPDTVRTQVHQALQKIQYAPIDQDSPEGVELPGGVIFDGFVPLKYYDFAKRELSKLGDTKLIITRAKEKAVSGKAHLKIWLQRI